MTFSQCTVTLRTARRIFFQPFKTDEVDRKINGVPVGETQHNDSGALTITLSTGESPAYVHFLYNQMLKGVPASCRLMWVCPELCLVFL